VFSVHMYRAFGTSELAEAFCWNTTDSFLALPSCFTDGYICLL